MSTPTTQLYLRFRAQSRRDNGNAMEDKMRLLHWDPDAFVANHYTDHMDNIHAIVREHLGRTIIEKPISVERLICEMRLYMERLNKNTSTKWTRMNNSSRQLILREYIDNIDKWIITITSFLATSTIEYHNRKDISTRLCEQINNCLLFPNCRIVTDLVTFPSKKKSVKNGKGSVSRKIGVKTEGVRLKHKLTEIITQLNAVKESTTRWAAEGEPAPVVAITNAIIAEEDGEDASDEDGEHASDEDGEDASDEDGEHASDEDL
jgi:hypothetical protein